MEILCTRPNCPRPLNSFADLDDNTTLTTTQQKYCTSCGMPLFLGGRYLPSRLLGKGGFGAAFLARDRYTTSLRECVVKQFQPSGDLDPQQLQLAQGLFQREAEVLEKLGNEHPQIPNSYAFFPLIVPGFQFPQEDQFFYLVQEYINGEDLEQELARKGRLSESEVQEVLTEVLNILKFVHENGSIHRDIKPSNIMRSRNGRLYLLDFGAVKQVTASKSPSGRSTGIYSMGFAPPEQMQGSQIFPATDFYALAVTCITLLTGKQPDELYDSYENCWNWRPHCPKVSDRLYAILDRMLRASPRERFASAEEVLQALQYPVGHSSVKIAPPPATKPTRSSRFTLTETLGNAAFLGFEGTLLFIAFGSLIPAPALSIGLWGMALGGITYALYRRKIEGKDLSILAGITLALVLFVPFLNELPLGFTLGLAVVVSAAAVAVTVLFNLVYKLISHFL